MNDYILKYIKSIKSSKNFSEKLSVMLITILLLLQIMVTFFVCKENNYANYNNFVSRVISSQVVNEERRKDNLSAVAAAIASNSKVLQIGEYDSPTYMDLLEPCSEMRKLMAVSSEVSNIYVYNDEFGYIYDAYGKCYDINNSAVKKIKVGIDAYTEKNEMFFMYSEASQQNSQNISSFEIFRSASSRKDLIIFENKTSQIFKEYKSIQKATESNMIVTTEGGKVIYGGNDFDCLEDISDTTIFKASLSDETYNIVNYNSEKYMVCHSYSDKTKRRYITMIPKKKVTVGFLYGKNYFALYICIIISIMILLGTLSIWRNFYRLLIGQKLMDFGKKKNSQNILIYKDYGPPEEKGNENLDNYLRSRFQESYFTAILMIIDNYDELYEQHTLADLSLIKYGLNNILIEIFEKYRLKVQTASESMEKIEIIVAMETKNQLETVKRALFDCQKSFGDYIGITSSFYVGSAENRSNLYRSYFSSQSISSYSFVYGSGIIVDEASASMMDEEEFDNIRMLCDKIKTDIIGASGEYMSDMCRLKESLKKTSPSQCYELLCYLLFNICSAIKNIEKKYNVENMIDVGKCFHTLSSAKYSDELLQIIELLYYDIHSILPDEQESKYEKVIEKCNKIIETSYQNQNLSVEYIADKIGFSRGHLTRVYKQTTGVSLSTKIADYRLDVAAKLLVETDKKVSDIVNEVGHINSSHFTVAFKQRFGESPLNYRKRHGHK